MELNPSIDQWAVMAGQTGWEKERDAFKNGGGSYWVPPPAAGMTASQLGMGYTQAITVAQGIERRLPEFKSGNNQGPMLELIEMLNLRAIDYQTAAELLAAANSPVPIPSTPGNPSVPSELPAGDGEGNGVLQLAMKNPIPIAIGAFFLINALLPKNKKIIKF